MKAEAEAGRIPSNQPDCIVNFRLADLTDEAAEQLYSILEPQHDVAPRLVEWMASAITWRCTPYDDRRRTLELVGALRDPGFAPLSIDLGRWKDGERLQAAVFARAMFETLTKPTAIAFATAILRTLAEHDKTLPAGDSPESKLSAEFAQNLRRKPQ